jgi:hypothetical protein
MSDREDSAARHAFGRRRIVLAIGFLLPIAVVVPVIAAWSVDNILGTAAILVVVALLIAWMVLLCLLFLRLRYRFDQSGLPNYREASRQYPVPEGVGERGYWTSGYIRDRPDGWPWPAMFRATQRGLLVRHRRVFRTRPRLFIPWNALTNPHRDTLPWYACPLEREFVELDIDGVQVKVLISDDAWRLAAERFVRIATD